MGIIIGAWFIFIAVLIARNWLHKLLAKLQIQSSQRHKDNQNKSLPYFRKCGRLTMLSGINIMKTNTAVKITDTHSGKSYLARTIGDCRDKTDKSGFSEVMRCSDVVTMGKIVFEPIVILLPFALWNTQ